MFVCMCVCVCLCLFLCVWCMCVCVCACMCVCVHAYLCVCVFVRACARRVCASANTHTHTHTYTNIHTNRHTHNKCATHAQYATHACVGARKWTRKQTQIHITYTDTYYLLSLDSPDTPKRAYTHSRTHTYTCTHRPCLRTLHPHSQTNVQSFLNSNRAICRAGTSA